MPCVSRQEYNYALAEASEDYYQYEDYDDSELMCEKCECFPFELGDQDFLCLSCRYNANVKQHGPPSFQNEFWINSPCVTGERLRSKIGFYYVNPVEKEFVQPWPVNTNSLKFEKKNKNPNEISVWEQFITFKTKKAPSITIIKEKPEFKWGTPN